ncbi:MAG: DUF2752 domain-containing protein [Clostridia bacterium]|nr:DUF2752 domain-containing protein [Clostridia bacterium]
MTEPEKKRLKRLSVGTVIAAVFAVGLLLLYLAGVPVIRCPFNMLTHLSCPGCGNIRAAAALLRLRFRESLSYNYAYPLEFAYLLWVLFSAAKRYLKEGKFSYYPKHPAADYVLLALLLVWWVVRNILKV